MQPADDAILRDREVLREQIQESIRQVRRSARHYRRVSTGLLLVGLLAGALSTALATEAFRGGRLAANVAQGTTGRVPAELPQGWRNVCGILAVLTLAGTLANGANSVFKFSDHQARTAACASALASLQADLLGADAVRPAALDKARAGLDTIRLSYDEYFP